MACKNFRDARNPEVGHIPGFIQLALGRQVTDFNTDIRKSGAWVLLPTRLGALSANSGCSCVCGACSGLLGTSMQVAGATRFTQWACCWCCCRARIQ
jgi:hypothetical protein